MMAFSFIEELLSALSAESPAPGCWGGTFLLLLLFLLHLLFLLFLLFRAPWEMRSWALKMGLSWSCLYLSQRWASD